MMGFALNQQVWVHSPKGGGVLSASSSLLAILS